jgi:hypothetical protein
VEVVFGGVKPCAIDEEAIEDITDAIACASDGSIQKEQIVGMNKSASPPEPPQPNGTLVSFTLDLNATCEAELKAVKVKLGCASFAESLAKKLKSLGNGFNDTVVNSIALFPIDPSKPKGKAKSKGKEKAAAKTD